MSEQDGKVEPIYYAIGGLFASPIIGLLLIVSGIAMILLTPLMPVFMYRHRKEELIKERIK